MIVLRGSLTSKVIERVRRTLYAEMTLLAATSTVALPQATDHTTVIATLVGAVVVALIAAGTAQWRLHVQLKAESKRLKEQLDHERAMNDLTEVRRLLDQTAAHTEEGSDLWIKLAAEVTRSPPRPEEITNLVASIGLVSDALFSDAFRLATRGLSNARAAAVEVKDALDTPKMLDLANRAQDDGVESVDADRRQLLSGFSGAAGGFYAIAMGIAASKLPSS